MVKKLLIFFLGIMLVGISIPITKSTVVINPTNNTSIPSLNLKILKQFSLLSIYFTVENNGTTTLHNVRYSGITIAGYVIYNSAPKLLAVTLEPGDKMVAISDRFIGIGIFTAKITITCDDGINASNYANGIVFGLVNFIP